MSGTPPEQDHIVTFQTYETSAAIIERAGWRIQPIPWEIRNEEGAINFIKQPSPRDRRNLLVKNRFRFLLIKYPDLDSRLYEQKSVIEAAQTSGWIGERFESFIKNDTAGSDFLCTPDGISFVAQTPKDDHFPFFAISLAQRSTEAHQYNDWEAIIFIRPAGFWENPAEPMLCRDPFPDDYLDPLKPDFMVLPVALLRCEVEQILKEVEEMQSILGTQDQDLTAKNIEELRGIKNKLFKLQKRNFFLRRRWKFACDLGETLTKAFGVLEKRYSSEDEMQETQEYSPLLRARVANQQSILKSVLESNTIEASITIQHQVIDSQIMAVIARRDSTSQKTIAILTLIFLPATFLAAIFSMGIFDWHAGQGDDDPTIISKWLWLYVVLSLILTLVVVVVWKILLRRTRRKLEEGLERR